MNKLSLIQSQEDEKRWSDRGLLQFGKLFAYTTETTIFVGGIEINFQEAEKLKDWLAESLEHLEENLRIEKELKEIESEYSSEYCSNEEATNIRVYPYASGWEIDACDDMKPPRYTEKTWTHYNDKILTKERALELVPDFCREIGRLDLVDKVLVLEY